jgi:hypothetical protein
MDIVLSDNENAYVHKSPNGVELDPSSTLKVCTNDTPTKSATKRKRNLCQAQGCGKYAQGMTDSRKKKSFCKKHGGGYPCQKQGCQTPARKKNSFCVKHGGGIKYACQKQGCQTPARKKNSFCVKHGGGYPCQKQGCQTPAQKKNSFCVKHGGGTTYPCQNQGCQTPAQCKNSFCWKHGGRTTYACQKQGCQTPAREMNSFCGTHGGGVRCSTCSLYSVQKTGLDCYSCRVGLGRIKQFELMVKAYLDSHPEFLGLYSYYDATLPCSPNRRRPDFVWLLLDRIVILEVDEYGHRYYNRDCEIARITELMEQGNALPLILIRFNPKEHLLSDLHALLQTVFVSPICGLLEVHFVGYKQEYDVVKEIEKLAGKRNTN